MRFYKIVKNNNKTITQLLILIKKVICNKFRRECQMKLSGVRDPQFVTHQSYKETKIYAQTFQLKTIKPLKKN